MPKKKKRKYKCSLCGESLSPRHAIKKDGQSYCKNCYRIRVKNFYMHDNISKSDLSRYLNQRGDVDLNEQRQNNKRLSKKEWLENKGE